MTGNKGTLIETNKLRGDRFQPISKNLSHNIVNGIIQANRLKISNIAFYFDFGDKGNESKIGIIKRSLLVKEI